MVDPYIFESTQDHAEWERLKMIEELCDEQSRTKLSKAGLFKGARCLEVGPGAGSIVEWVSDQVGPSGSVVAVDLNPRFVERLASSIIKIIKGDIASVSLDAESFDVIHGRYVLLHIAQQGPVLRRLVSFLKPGGKICFEEPDFELSLSGSFGEDAERINRVHLAVQNMYRNMGCDPGTGRKLPEMFEGNGLDVISVDAVSHLSAGQSLVADMMGRSIGHVRPKLLQTGAASDADIDLYIKETSNPERWNLYYTTVSVVGRKPR